MSNDARTGSGVIIDYSQERIHSGKSYIATFKTPDASPLADNAAIDFRTFGVEPQFTHDSEWVLKTNTNYLFRTINRQGGNQPIAVIVQWDEPFG